MNCCQVVGAVSSIAQMIFIGGPFFLSTLHYTYDK
jgi:hypothetical protein